MIQRERDKTGNLDEGLVSPDILATAMIQLMLRIWHVSISSLRQMSET